MLEPEDGWASLWPLDPQIHFLNHGSFGACPRHVLDHQTELRNRLERQPVEYLARQLPELLEGARHALAEFLACEAEDLALVRNTTAGVNAVVRSLELSADDELIATNHAYGACRNAMDFVADRANARLVVVEIPFPLESADLAVDAIIGSVSSDTRLVLIDHVTSSTGLVLPMERILSELEGVDVLIDGAHAPGMLELNLGRLRPAFYAGNCHKWMCAPKGAGFLYVRRDLQEQVRPVAISHGATLRGGRSRFKAEFDWIGTDDPTAALCIPEAVRFMGSLLPGGWSELMDRNHRLAVSARRRLCEALKLSPPAPEEMIGSMASIPVAAGSTDRRESAFDIDPLQRELLSGFGIEVFVEPWPNPPDRLLRLSAQLYNRSEQYDLLAGALKELL